jgi:two-component sensor histidine kinase
MMGYKIIISFLIFFNYSFILCAKDLPLALQVKRIDSLILSNNFLESERETDYLFNLLTNKSGKNEYVDLKLTVMLQKAYLCIRNSKFSRAVELSLDVIDQAKKHNLPEIEYKGYLMAAEIYEHTDHLDLCKNYLDKAYVCYLENKLTNAYSTYCIRKSSYSRFTKKIDSAKFYANEGLYYAKKHQNKRDLSDAYLLLGILLSDQNYRESIKYTAFAANEFLKRNDYQAVSIMYCNISHAYLKHKEVSKAMMYSDSAMWYKSKLSNSEMLNYITFETRSLVFENLGHQDSALFYHKKFHTAYVKYLGEHETKEIKDISEKYENNKKEAVIQSKNQQMIFIISILAVIALSTLILIRKNKKINTQNKIISKQLEELMRTLEQKQVLLSELQHRVKNNLQHVISILEIQKESVDFNNIEELIRSNQNRIHSMALLHEKLNISDSLNDVDLRKYISELAELVKHSYDNRKKKINLEINCEVETLTIEKALPIGLITAELLSNSMKHAFKNRNTGTINIDIKKDELLQKIKFSYADSGHGFDFNVTNQKGLGLEIINGLIDQLGGTIEIAKTGKGFSLTIHFR